MNVDTKTYVLEFSDLEALLKYGASSYKVFILLLLDVRWQSSPIIDFNVNLFCSSKMQGLVSFVLVCCMCVECTERSRRGRGVQSHQEMWNNQYCTLPSFCLQSASGLALNIPIFSVVTNWLSFS